MSDQAQKPVLPPDSNEPSVFSGDGNRKRGFKCAPCAKYKKGCKGTSPICQTCIFYHRGNHCTFTQIQVAEDKRARLQKRKEENRLRITASDETKTPPMEQRPTNSLTSAQERPQRRAEESSLQRTLESDDHPTTKDTPGNFPRNHLQRHPPTTQHSVEVIRKLRTNRQKRRVNAMSPADIVAVQNLPVRLFIQRYNAPFSRTLLLMVQEIVATAPRTDGDVELHLKAAKKLFDRVWHPHLSMIDDDEEVIKHSRNMTEEQKVDWLRKSSPQPISESEVEQFFFVYLCVSMNGWAETKEQKRRAIYWYEEYINRHWDYLRDSLAWHEQMRTSYNMRASWLREWLKEQEEKD